MGSVTTVCTRPYEADDAFLGFLNSPTDTVWDLRSRDPRPGIRLLGQFVARNKFVALIPASRSVELPYIERGPLNEADSPEWKAAIRDCEVLSYRLLHPFEPIKGVEISEILDEPYYIE